MNETQHGSRSGHHRSRRRADVRIRELGVRFRADVNGFITGVRFWKGALNVGPHTGNLWSATGQRLATANFSNS